MGRRLKRIMLWLAFAAALYGFVVLTLYLLQDRLVFPGARFGQPEPLPALQGVVVDTLPLRDGSTVRVAESEAHGATRAVLLFFLGNGEDLTAGVQWAAELSLYGVRVIVPEYPGYGTSGGEPSVESFERMAEAAAKRAEQRANEHFAPLVLGGFSMGTFCAVHLAARNAGARLLLAAPPSSLLEESQGRYWWLPVKALLRHRFDNLGKAGFVKVPALVIHGDADEVVPLASGRKLALALGGETRWIEAPGLRHEGRLILPDGPYGRVVGEFLVGR